MSEIIADAIVGTEFVTVEVSGVKVDGMPEGRFSGEVVMGKESVMYAIWSLAKSIGISSEIDAVLAKEAPGEWEPIDAEFAAQYFSGEAA